MSSKRDRVLKQNKKRKSGLLYMFSALLLILVAGGAVTAALKMSKGEESVIRGKYEVVKIKDGKVTLPTAAFDDYRAKYYTYDSSEGPINFFVVKSSDNVIRAAFDACDVCYRARRGYSQSGDIMVCNNCGQQFPTNRINVEKGGCNPAPLERTVEGEQLIIKQAGLELGRRFFIF